MSYLCRGRAVILGAIGDHGFSHPSAPSPANMSRNHPAALRANRVVIAAALIVGTAACGESAEHRQTDSVAAVESEQQRELATRLSAQKDSLMTVVLDADQFIGQVDSSISRVKGLPARSRGTVQAEGVLQEQLEARRDMLFKVDALVKRAQVTASQLAESKRREGTLRRENATLRDSLGADQRLIAQLGETIERQLSQISGLQESVGQLTAANAQLGEELRVSLASSARVYYVIGSEDELVKKGVIVREGGMNLLVARPGRTVHPARQLDHTLFTAIDAREVSRITVPDSTRRYRVVSRHSLDDAEVANRKDASFQGDLRITNANRFWSASRYLIVIES